MPYLIKCVNVLRFMFNEITHCIISHGRHRVVMCVYCCV